MKNVGGIDKILRIVAGLVLLSLVFVGPKTMWGLVGLLPLLTGLFGFCPLYPLLGLNTCPVSGKK
ncbi:MAG: hypothetical protein QG652_766 [Pseudomonadota bacterium]|nr:hypothetical protein [Pseudomonadota bacterium]